MATMEAVMSVARAVALGSEIAALTVEAAYARDVAALAGGSTPIRIAVEAAKAAAGSDAAPTKDTTAPAAVEAA